MLPPARSASVRIASTRSSERTMYASVTLYVLGTSLALGSWWGLLAGVLMIPVLVWRLFDEERMLAAQLPGYTAYQQRVRRRLVPFVW